MSGSTPQDAAELRRLRRALAIFRTLATHMAADLRLREDAGRHFGGRIGAIGRAALACGSSGADLHCLILDELLACAVPPGRCQVDGPETRLQARASAVVSLAMHELAMNSVKFGALRNGAGSLEISWLRREPDELQLSWIESRVSFEAPDAGAHGFGSELVHRLIRSELRGSGEMLFSGDGVRCNIVIPLNHVMQIDA